MSDLIDRRETMQALVAEYNRRFMAGDRGGLKMAWIEKAVDDVPSAQVKRQKGKWMQEYKEATTRHCSNCDFIVLEEEANNFCPNCGADMRE